MLINSTCRPRQVTNGIKYSPIVVIGVIIKQEPSENKSKQLTTLHIQSE